jgi:hypothetical protein
LTKNLTDKFESAVSKANKSNLKRDFTKTEEFIEWRKNVSKTYSLKDEIKYDLLKRLPLDESNLSLNVSTNVTKSSNGLAELYRLITLKEVMALFFYGKSFSNLTISVGTKCTSMQGYILLNCDDTKLLSLVQSNLKSIKKKMKSKFKLIFEEYEDVKRNETFLTIGFEVSFFETIKITQKITKPKTKRGVSLEAL